MHRLTPTLCILLSCAACTSKGAKPSQDQSDAPRVDRVRIIMGTQAFVSLENKDSHLAGVAFGVMEELDGVLSTYKESSEASRLNRAGHLSSAPDELLELIRRSLMISTETDGFFDVTIGSLTEDHYGFNRLSEQEAKDLKSPSAPPNLKAVGSSAIEIKGREVRFLKPGVRIDFGGIGKGYAVDKAIEALKANGTSRGRVGLSGDFRCLDTCLVEVTDPFDPERVYTRFKTKRPDTAVTTSGNYRRYLGDKKHNHLVDPKTGQPQQTFASVTLVSSSDNTRLDALATAVAVMPFERAIAFLEARPEIGYLLILTNGERRISARFHDFVEER